MARGGREGWYKLFFGSIMKMQPNGRHRLIIQFQDYATAVQDRLVGDFMIDCTGLDNELALHPLLADLHQRCHLPQNLAGQLTVTPDFELMGLRNRQGQAYLAGIMAFGNDFAPVDSFMGLQYAAQKSVDALHHAGAPGVGNINGIKSLRQWWRWWQGVAP